MPNKWLTQSKDEIQNLNWNNGRCFIQDAKILLHQSTRWMVQYVPIRINLVAHALAKDALNSNVISLDFVHFLSCIENLVLLDAE